MSTWEKNLISEIVRQFEQFGQDDREIRITLHGTITTVSCYAGNGTCLAAVEI